MAPAVVRSSYSAPCLDSSSMRSRSACSSRAATTNGTICAPASLRSCASSCALSRSTSIVADATHARRSRSSGVRSPMRASAPARTRTFAPSASLNTIRFGNACSARRSRPNCRSHRIRRRSPRALRGNRAGDSSAETVVAASLLDPSIDAKRTANTRVSVSAAHPPVRTAIRDNPIPPPGFVHQPIRFALMRTDSTPDSSRPTFPHDPTTFDTDVRPLSVALAETRVRVKSSSARESTDVRTPISARRAP